MSDEWGPWIEHDGACPPIGLRKGMRVILWFSKMSGSVAPTDCDHYENFKWRWRPVRVGWFGSKMVRVCDDAERMPIIRYRIRKPRAITMLEEIAQGIREPEDA